MRSSDTPGDLLAVVSERAGELTMTLSCVIDPTESRGFAGCATFMLASCDVTSKSAAAPRKMLHRRLNALMLSDVRLLRVDECNRDSV